MQWGENGSARTQKSQSPCDQSKKMMIIFFDVKGVIYKNYIPNG